MNRLQEIIDEANIHSLPDMITVVTRRGLREPNEIVLELPQEVWNRAAMSLGSRFAENRLFDMTLADSTITELTPPELTRDGDVVPGWFITISCVVVNPPSRLYTKNLIYDTNVPGLVTEEKCVYAVDKGFNHKLLHKIQSAAETISGYARTGKADRIHTDIEDKEAGDADTD